ncbi:F-box only protein 9, partial [Trichinella sp. T6]
LLMGDQPNCTGKGFVCSCSSSSEEDEDEESSSSSSRLDISGQSDSTCGGSSDAEESVDHFRQILRKSDPSERVQSKIAECSKEQSTYKSDEKKLLAAKELFQMGVHCEQQGKMQEAVRHYKQALLIEPTIERKLYGQTVIQKSDYARNVRKRNTSTRKSRTSWSGSITANSEELIQKIYQRLANVSKVWHICEPNVEQQLTHISALPVEILMQIFRLVVSADLDVAQLEQLSMVCGGFYCLARNSDLWHAICAKIWKSRLGPLPSDFTSWREVYMNRAHLHFNGLYVSKASYVRMGERGYYDHISYNPWHVVVHYRYLRFFPDDSVIMITTADPPKIVVPLMRTKVAKHATAVIGQFTLDGLNCVSMSFQRVTNGSDEVIRGGRIPVAFTSTQSLLMLENTKHGQYNILSWLNYEVMFKYKSAPDVVSKCCLNDKDFPPFNFYRVKSHFRYCSTLILATRTKETAKNGQIRSTFENVEVTKYEQLRLNRFGKMKLKYNFIIYSHLNSELVKNIQDWFRNRKERLKHVSMPIELYRPTSTPIPATTATRSPELTSTDLDIFQVTTAKSVRVAEYGYPNGDIPERIVRIRIHMIARRVQLESVQHAAAGQMVDVYTARMRWTEPGRWNDAELDHSERYYDLKCWLSMEGSKSRMVVNRRLSAQFNGCGEKFRFPTKWALAFQCAVRAVNGRGNVGLWTLSKRIQVQQIPVYLPGISGVDVRRLTDSEIKRILENARLLVDT